MIRARPHHVSDIMNILRHPNIIKRGFYRPNWLRKNMDNHEVWILVNKNEEIFGIIIGIREPPVRIKKLVIRPDVQHMRLGTRMVKEFIRDYEATAPILPNTLPFWEKLGFKIVRQTMSLKGNPLFEVRKFNDNSQLDEFCR